MVRCRKKDDENVYFGWKSYAMHNIPLYWLGAILTLLLCLPQLDERGLSRL